MQIRVTLFHKSNAEIFLQPCCTVSTAIIGGVGDGTSSSTSSRSPLMAEADKVRGLAG